MTDYGFPDNPIVVIHTQYCIDDWEMYRGDGPRGMGPANDGCVCVLTPDRYREVPWMQERREWPIINRSEFLGEWPIPENTSQHYPSCIDGQCPGCVKPFLSEVKDDKIRD